MDDQNRHDDQERDGAGSQFDGLFRGMMSGFGGSVSIGIMCATAKIDVHNGSLFGQVGTRNASHVNHQAPEEREAGSDIPNAGRRTRSVGCQTVPTPPPKTQERSDSPAPDRATHPEAPLEDQGLDGLSGFPKQAIQYSEDAGGHSELAFRGIAVGENMGRASNAGVGLAGKSAEGTGFAGAGVPMGGRLGSERVAGKVKAEADTNGARIWRGQAPWDQPLGATRPAFSALCPNVPSAGVAEVNGFKFCSKKSPQKGVGTKEGGNMKGAAWGSGVAYAGRNGASHRDQNGVSRKRARVAERAEDNCWKVPHSPTEPPATGADFTEPQWALQGYDSCAEGSEGSAGQAGHGCGK